MRFLVDAQLPPALARWLVRQDHEAEHVSEVGLAETEDWTLWEQAVKRGAVIVIKNEDFALSRKLEPSGPAVIWIRLYNTRKRGDSPRWLEPLLSRTVAALERGETLIEVA